MFLKSLFCKCNKFDISFKKYSQSSPKNVEKGIFVTKITNTFDFSSKKEKEKNGPVFLRRFTWNHPKMYRIENLLKGNKIRYIMG